MDKLIDWITGLPKAIQILLAVTLLSLLAFGVYRFVFGKEEETQETAPAKVLLEVPGASIDDKEMSRMETYRKDNISNSVSASDFWNQLEEENKGGLLVGTDDGNPLVSIKKEDVYLDPNEYSEMEIYYIREGTKTKEEVDAEHAQRRREEAEREVAERSQNSSKTQENSDSAYFARMEKAYQLAMKYSTNPQSESAQLQATSDLQEEEPRRIEIPKATALPDDALVGDGVISSLERESVGVIYEDGDITLRPALATFLKSERVTAGQRVVMRLKEEMKLSDGTVIPANTHITGICSVGARLEIEISTVNYGGRIYRTDMSVYDNDGTEGIYCPVIEQKKGNKAAGKIAGQAATGLASTAASLFTGNPYVGRIASSSINELSRMTLSDGSVSINIVAGYEFYIFENIKKNGKR